MNKNDYFHVFFSIIMTTFNREKYIERAIISVVKQHYSNWELIIIDDGSSDETYKIVEKYTCDKRIRYIYQTNNGPYLSRINGIKLAKGEYICFIDSDDEYLDTFLSKANEIVNTYVSIDLIHFNVFFEHDGDVVSYDNESKPILLSKDMYLLNLINQGNLYSSCCNKVIRRKNIKDINFLDANGRFGEDMFMMAQVVDNCQTTITLSKSYYIYHLDTNNSLSKSLDYNKQNNQFDMLTQLYVHVLKKYNYKPSAIKSFLLSYNNLFFGVLNSLEEKKTETLKRLFSCFKKVNKGFCYLSFKRFVIVLLLRIHLYNLVKMIIVIKQKNYAGTKK